MSEWVWRNGQYTDATEVVDRRDRGFLLGDAVFETLLVIDGTAVLFSAHMERLARGCAACGLRLVDAPEVFDQAVTELARRNGCTQGRAVARITVSRGAVARGLAPPPDTASASILISCAPALEPSTQSLSLHISMRRKYSGSSFRDFKAASHYGENLLARRDAARAGCDDAVMLNEMGRVVGASAANIFIVEPDNCVATPTLAEGALPGVIRSVVIDAVAELNLQFVEKPIEISQLQAAAAVFLTNSLIGLAPAHLAQSASTSDGKARADQSERAGALIARLTEQVDLACRRSIMR